MGSCGDASLLLGKYLDEMGLGQFDYVCGELGRQSHAWLEKVLLQNIRKPLHAP
ncbi:MAG: hypothetical protein BWY74_03344 [Firmicutes bacterium ADurb.Bin419]|nr:MAG: hypothetical protein BWY74_03344 [Firmicutes bacterium ADurb.Bin419]